MDVAQRQQKTLVGYLVGAENKWVVDPLQPSTLFDMAQLDDDEACKTSLAQEIKHVFYVSRLTEVLFEKSQS